MECEPVYILAGGQSSRFGSDKARAMGMEGPLIAGVAGIFRRFAGEVVVIADRPRKYVDLGLETVADRIPGMGPLGGLHGALSDRMERIGEGWSWVASCDFVSIQQHWLDALARADRKERWIICYEGQPLLGLYHTDLIGELEQRLETGRLALRDLVREIAAHTLQLPIPSDWTALAHINRPDELAAARQAIRKDLTDQ